MEFKVKFSILEESNESIKSIASDSLAEGE